MFWRRMVKTVTIIANDGVFQPNCRNMLVIAWSTWSNLLFMYWTKRRQEAPLQPRSYAIKFPKGTRVALFAFCTRPKTSKYNPQLPRKHSIIAYYITPYYPLSKETLNSRFLLSGYSPDTKTSKVSSLLLPPPHPANPPKLPKNQSPIVPSIIGTSKTPKQKTGNSHKEESPLFQRRTKLSSPRITESS